MSKHGAFDPSKAAILLCREAIDSCRGAISHLRDGQEDGGVSARLKRENERLRERIDLLERSEVEEVPATSPRPNNYSVRRAIAKAAREMASCAYGDVGGVSDEVLVEWARYSLTRVSFPEAFVLIAYYGLDGKGARTLKAIARFIGRSTTNVGRSREVGIRKLRHHTVRKHFRELAEGVKG